MLQIVISFCTTYFIAGFVEYEKILIDNCGYENAYTDILIRTWEDVKHELEGSVWDIER